MPNSALVESRLVVRMDIFNRVFQVTMWTGLDPLISFRIGGECGGFAGTGGAGDQHQAGFSFGDVLENLRKFQLIQRGMVAFKLAADDGIISALREYVDTEAGLVGKRVGSVA